MIINILLLFPSHPSLCISFGCVCCDLRFVLRWQPSLLFRLFALNRLRKAGTPSRCGSGGVSGRMLVKFWFSFRFPGSSFGDGPVSWLCAGTADPVTLHKHKQALLIVGVWPRFRSGMCRKMAMRKSAASIFLDTLWWLLFFYSRDPAGSFCVFGLTVAPHLARGEEGYDCAAGNVFYYLVIVINKKRTVLSNRVSAKTSRTEFFRIAPLKSDPDAVFLFCSRSHDEAAAGRTGRWPELGPLSPPSGPTAGWALEPVEELAR